MKYISRGIVLDEETWKAFNRLREVHGSYNKALRFMLSAGGVFEPSETTLETVQTSRGLVSRATNTPTTVRPFKGAIPKPKDARK